MNEFVITSQQGVKCVFHSRSYDASGWLEAYTIDLEADDFRASAGVDNPGYGFPPSALFTRLASQWRGWVGTEEWKSPEGKLVITATSDRTGHICISFALPQGGPYWSASGQVFVEAGHLENIAHDAKAFFNDGA